MYSIAERYMQHCKEIRKTSHRDMWLHSSSLRTSWATRQETQDNTAIHLLVYDRHTTLLKPATQCFGSGRYEDIFVYDSNLTFISPIWPSLCFIDAKMFAEINSSIIYYWDEFHTPLFSNLIMQVWEKWCVCHKLANVSLCCLVSLEAATM